MSPTKRPAQVTSLAKYSKMKGVCKLVDSAKKPKKDTDSCFSEILEATLDSVFSFDEPPSASKSAACARSPNSARKAMEVDAESDQDWSQAILHQSPTKVTRKPGAVLLALRRTAEPLLKLDDQVVSKITASGEDDAIVATRRKELKLLSKESVQDLAESMELEKGRKDDMIEAVLAHESNAREELRAREGQAKQVVANKKQELAAQSIKSIKSICSKKRLKLTGTKAELVKRLLGTWKEEGGVEAGLRLLARKSRRSQLASMDKKALFSLCDKRRIDALVKEVMVERLLSYEIVKGL